MAERILYLITLAEVGGAQTHLLQLLSVHHHGRERYLAAGALGPLTSAAAAHNTRVFVVPGLGRALHLRDDLRALKHCIRLICALRPTLVHAHSSKAGLLARIAGRLTHTPVVFTVHGWGFKPGVPARRRLVVWLSERLAAPFTDGTICVSRHDLEIGRRYRVGRPAQMYLIPNALDVHAPVADPEAEATTVIMTARFKEPKDHALLLRAFARARRPGTRLLLVGSGPEQPAMERLAAELGLASVVEFLGDRVDVPALLATAQLFVLTSRYEGLPISVLEAMRAGLPVVASAVGGIPEIIEDRMSGLLVPPNDLRALTRALHELLADAQLRGSLGLAARRAFLAKHRSEHMIAATEAVYHAALSRADTLRHEGCDRRH